MQLLRASLAVLIVAAALPACSGSNDTGSAGGWRVSGAHIRIIGDTPVCKSPAPAVDTFEPSPSPQPGCTPPAAAYAQPSAAPATPAHRAWQRVHTEDYRSATSQAWHPIYTTYTAPPGTGIYAPMVNATDQPMPTPLDTPTPSPLPTPTQLPTQPPMPTYRPAPPVPSATPY